MSMRTSGRLPLRSSLLSLVALGLGAMWSSSAAAHIEMTTPDARYSPDMQKAEPCGHPDNPPGDGIVATYQEGETITVVFDEFVNHQGHYRIALDPTGTDNFTSPGGFDDFYNSPEVLLDDIPDDQNGGIFMVDVTLPEGVTCNPCTLQLIQVMNDGAWGPGVSDLYFQCADIAIEGVAADTGTGGGGDSTGGGGGTTGGGGEDTGPGGEGGSLGGETASPTGGGEDSGTTGGGGGSTTDEETDDSEGGCSCRSSGDAPWSAAWMLLGLAALRRRRAR